MPRRYDSQETKRRAIHAAAVLFLEEGYNRTTIRDICRKANISSGSLFHVYKDKEAILYELVVYMFSNQFQGAEALLGDGFSPVQMYALETALQLAMTELNENIRDIYMTAYMLPSTSAYIYRQTAKQLSILFGERMPGYSEQDFYECEIGTGNMIRGYMSIPCDETFTLEKKIRRFLDLSLAVYHVPPDQREETISGVLTFDLRTIARHMITSVLEWIQIGFPASDENLSKRMSEYKK